MRKKSKVLSDHKQRKKKLVPPLIDAMSGKHSPYSWVRDLMPELIWLCLLHETLGIKRAVECVVRIAEVSNEIFEEENIPLLSKASSYLLLNDEDKKKLIFSLDQSGHLSDLKRAIEPLLSIFPSYPLSFFYPNCIQAEEVPEILTNILPKLYDRHSKEATFVNASAVSMGFTQGKLVIAMKDSPLSQIDEVIDYPDTDKSRMVASSLRAMMGAMLTITNGDAPPDNEWTETFWTRLSKSGPCLLKNGTEIYGTESIPDDPMGKIVYRFCDAAKKELHERLDNWGFDLNEIEKFEVIGGLLARQTTLATDLALCPMSWNPNSSPLFHRAMADVYITLSWIFKNPQERSERFVEDGIGNIKLEVAHRKKQMEETRDFDPQEQEMIALYESWIASQRIEALVEVNLGNWTGITTRKMADEAGCLDFYNYVYQPFSAAAHPSWSHIHFHNLQHCSHPAHRDHSVPLVKDYGINPYFLYLGGKYLQKTFAKFDEETSIKIEAISAFDQLYDDIYEVEESD